MLPVSRESKGDDQMEAYRFYGWDQQDIRGEGENVTLTPIGLYNRLKRLWSRESCAPRMRESWNEANPTLGQCSITAFLVQDLFGGRVYGVPLPDGNFHCYNVVNGRAFDLTSEQFGSAYLSYENNPEQFREAHFQKEEKRLRYEKLRRALLRDLRENPDRMIALTFDDGPNTTTTPRVLDVLSQYGALASFFLIERNIDPASARVAARAWNMGCEINNHSVTHRHMGAMSEEEIRREIDACSRAILQITGTAPRFFRPPYIDVSPTLFQAVDLTCICGAGCEDWVMEVSAETRAERVLSAARDGEIILLHDMQGNENTVEALRALLPELRARGYRFVTCGQLFDEKGVLPVKGRLYTNVFQTADRIDR